ncbi:IS200/IS605 family element transposase accessory protein TnpB [Trichococcus shcherbakoviae subsp. psychrophilus]|uniref:IS200/IS605 family element transposase accessory protein TnpB n=2 Tax=Trichococcus shcherbakoviae TaxID=2094020 RepID=A0A5C5EC80_9LACT|nr:IS200/IS605 family element transposase accessory protein TnpB [Trichococcus shcherbakoviae subsp. psychrophilus]
MSQMKTVQIKLKPTKTQDMELKRLSLEYIRQANALVKQAVSEEKFPRVSSKHIESDIPSVLKNELIRYAKSKHKQFGKCIFKKPMLSYNNQNFSVDATAIRFPIMADGKAKKTAIKAVIPEEIFALLSESKLGTLRITKKGFHWMAQICVRAEDKEFVGDGILGVDLGILCPAVGVVAADGKTQFFGNGRQNKHLRRKYKELRRQLGKQKKVNAIRAINNKESRIMRDINHKLSRQIVTFAAENNCGTIHLENLSGIRRTSRLRGKNKASLHNWTFFELASFIEYKARELGIKVIYIKPEYTSQSCPSCGERNKVKDRNYQCGCGYHAHRDRVGALNIAKTI